VKRREKGQVPSPNLKMALALFLLTSKYVVKKPAGFKIRTDAYVAPGGSNVFAGP